MLTMTDTASSKVKELIQAEDNPELVLRVAVRPGGCSGLSYEMFFDTDVADDLVIENLANWHTRINANRLDGKHFERPIAAKADVAKAGGNVDEEAQTADAGATFDHRHEVVRLGPLDVGGDQLDRLLGRQVGLVDRPLHGHRRACGGATRVEGVEQPRSEEEPRSCDPCCGRMRPSVLAGCCRQRAAA